MRFSAYRFFAPALLAVVMQLGLPVMAALHTHRDEPAGHDSQHSGSSESTKCPVCHLIAAARHVVEPAAPTVTIDIDPTPCGQCACIGESAHAASPDTPAQPRAPPVG